MLIFLLVNKMFLGKSYRYLVKNVKLYLNFLLNYLYELYYTLMANDLFFNKVIIAKRISLQYPNHTNIN